jgi:hypothetical protein
MAISFIAGLVVLPNAFGPLSVFDAGLSASAATFMLHGEVPYRDFWWLYGPGSGILVAIPTAIFGPSLAIPRLIGLCLVLLQAGIVYSLVRKQADHLPSALIAIASVGPEVALTELDVTSWSLSVTLALLSIYCRTSTSASPGWAGVIAGFTFVTRLDVGGYLLLALLVLPGRRRLLGGFASVSLPFLAFAAATTPLGDLYDQLIGYPLFGLREFRSVPPPNLNDARALVLFLPVILIPKAAIAAAFIRLAVVRHLPHTFLVVALFAALCQLQTLGRGDFSHQAQAATAGFVLLGLWVSRASQASATDGARSGRSSKASALVIVLCGFAVLSGSIAFARVATRLDRSEIDFLAGVRTLRANTTRDEAVFVGLTNHRFTFANPMLAYYLADRRAGVRVAMFNPGVTNTDRVQQAMVEELVASRTEVVLLNDAYANVAEPSNNSRIPGSTVLDAFISAAFVEVCRYGETRIFASRSRMPAVACAEPREAGITDVLFGLQP